ncbi:MAG: hypothetical protein IPM16_10180 [Chloroflexi bacterium]|nr:hypothetical protein [Chloroflexota bacterium]
MGRVLVVVGVILLIVGVALPFASSFGFMRDIGSFTQSVVTDPTADEFCQPGETLEIEQGASTRTGTSSTSGTGRTTLYYCVTGAGERRDVTASVVGNIIGEATSLGGPIGSILTGSIGAFALTGGGIALIVIGALVAARSGSRSARRIVGVEQPFNPTNAGVQGQSMIDVLKAQLDAAYRNGQLSREDYERALEQLKRR